ncbi:MAG: SEC-C metal-binding domain-containing protein [Myxococcota bacterium]|nr:SEC-C metal-binding domain-containing protein [Myxococcota bacterium]
MGEKLGRNQPCSCGSGKKYKNCHLGKKESLAPPPLLLGLLAVVAAISVALGFTFGWGNGARVGALGAVIVVAVYLLRNPPKKHQDRSGGSNIDFGK